MVAMSDKILVVITDKALWLGSAGQSSIPLSKQAARRIRFEDIFTLTIARDMGQANFSIFSEGGGDVWIVSKWIMELSMKTL